MRRRGALACADRSGSGLADAAVRAADGLRRSIRSSALLYSSRRRRTFAARKAQSACLAGEVPVDAAHFEAAHAACVSREQLPRRSAR